jgi:hypothetical protein
VQETIWRYFADDRTKIEESLILFMSGYAELSIVQKQVVIDNVNSEENWDKGPGPTAYIQPTAAVNRAAAKAAAPSSTAATKKNC